MCPDYDPNNIDSTYPDSATIEYTPGTVEYASYPTRETAKSQIRYKIEEYHNKAEKLQAFLDMLELLQDGYTDDVDEILYEMVCSLK